MALNFPDSPTLNQVYTDSTSGFSYKWNGTAWISYESERTNTIQLLDDISGSFNGITTSFSLSISNQSITPVTDNQLVINLGGALQNAIEDYTVSGSNIVFNAAPVNGLSFVGTFLGSALPLNLVSDGSVTPEKLSTGGPLWDYLGSTRIIGTGSTALLVNGNARITGILTVGSSSITLDGSNNKINVGSAATIGSQDISISGITTALSLKVGSVTVNSSGINLSGVVTATSLSGNASNLTGVTFGITDLSVTDDSGGNPLYPIVTTATSGNVTAVNVSTSKLSFSSSNGVLNTTTLVGAGTSLTSLSAANISSGTVPTARLASGTANSSSYLRGDQTWATVSGGITISDDTSTNSTFYPTFTTATSGTISAHTVSSSKLTFNPSTGRVSSTVLTASSDLRSPNGASSARPSSPIAGSFRWNSDYNTMEVYTGTEWRRVILGYVPVDPSTARGVFGGGFNPGSGITNVIDYITIGTTGNALDFGDLTVARHRFAACSSSTRGVFAGGLSIPAFTRFNVIDYITIASTGNATDFGDLTQIRSGAAGCSSSTRGVFGGGFSSPVTVTTIDYITIATTGNATNFGTLTVARTDLGACSSNTRGVFGGGSDPAANTIDYITISTTGSATDFGDLTVTPGRQDVSACSNTTRGIFGGGSSPVKNVIDYITIATTGNATDFGDLTSQRAALGACSTVIRGVFGGGEPSTNTIDYVTIATTGNATDFGDLTQERYGVTACSNGHGGLF